MKKRVLVGLLLVIILAIPFDLAIQLSRFEVVDIPILGLTIAKTSAWNRTANIANGKPVIVATPTGNAPVVTPTPVVKPLTSYEKGQLITKCYAIDLYLARDACLNKIDQLK